MWKKEKIKKDKDPQEKEDASSFPPSEEEALGLKNIIQPIFPDKVRSSMVLMMGVIRIITDVHGFFYPW